MKILVTGGAGFIGSHIVEHYQDKAEEIRAVSYTHLDVYKRQYVLVAGQLPAATDERSGIK